MSDKKISLWDLEKHETKDTLDSHINGELTVVWRDWDNLIKDHPKMVNINFRNRQSTKIINAKCVWQMLCQMLVLLIINMLNRLLHLFCFQISLEI